ncbi:MAG TPA: hypothetical protein VHS99_14495, partial [Chloroflexota bacterium]|nr:hypothetical protein [Chloroflexota bacterium]
TLAVPPGAGPRQAGFDGAGAPRVAQLLGDPLPVRGPTRGLYLLSACAALLPVNLGVCLFETVAYLAR